VRLLLDEHYSPAIAQQLRQRGHDVESVDERDDLRSSGDVELLAAARAEHRAFVTNNVVDFAPLISDAALRGERHFGVVYTSDRSLPRAKRTIGRFVELLDELLAARPAEDAMVDEVVWLADSSTGRDP